MSKRRTRLTTSVCMASLVASLLLANSAFAQDQPDHDHTETSTSDQPDHDHEETSTADQPATAPADSHMSHDMTPEMTSQEQESATRDPHAYSGGYTRDSGPYSSPESSQHRHADEDLLTGLWIDRVETREGDAEDFQEFAGYAWLGNSYQRVMLRTELEWRDQTLEESKTELLYSRAVSAFWNMEIGGRYDHGDKDHRQWLALGISGMAPFWIEVNGTAYVGPEGHSAASIEAEYDLYLSQRLILQARGEVDFYGDSDLEAGHGKGLSKSLFGLRLRYELDRRFAPFIGYERVHRHGETTDVFKPLGQHRENQWVAGLRFWF